MSGSKRSASKAPLKKHSSLASCIISEREKLTHLAIATKGVGPGGRTSEQLLPYSKLIQVDSLGDSVVAGIMIEFDSTLVGILVATENLSSVVTALQTHHLQRIAGKSGENISRSDIRAARAMRPRGNQDHLIFIGQFKNDLFNRAKALNRELSGESYYPPEPVLRLPERDYIKELGITGSRVIF